MQSLRITLILCFLLAIQSAEAYREKNLLLNLTTEEQLKEVLVLNQQWVKYPGYTDREGWENLIGENKAYYIEQGEKNLDYMWKVIRVTDYLEFTRSGSREPMSGNYNANINAIVSLFLAEMAEGKGRFLDQLMNGIFHTCEMTSWSISAHQVLQRGGGTFPKKEEKVLELVSTDVAATFSWIYYFLHEEFDKITPLFSQRLYQELEERIMIPYMNESRFWWMAFDVTAEKGFVNNWNPWCNSNVLQCFLLLENDKDKLAKAVYRTMVSTDKFLNYTKDDGACEEGPSYWGHAGGKLFDFLDLLYNATGGKLSLFDAPVVKNMGEYISRSYVGNGWVVNFADASAKERLDYHLIARYGEQTNSKELKDFSAYLKKQHPSSISINRDLFRMLANMDCEKQIDSYNPVHPHVPFTWYPETEFCYMANGDLFFAGKSGYNDESHNHNDVGTFNFYVNNYPVFIDLGVETYTRKTFSSERYTIWTMQSDYHNLPRINGHQQKFGKTYKGTNVKANKNSFSLDMTQAYPQEAGINKWQRSYRLTSNSLLIEDDFSITNPTVENVLHFMTWGEVSIPADGKISIKCNDQAVSLLYDKNLFEASTEKLAVEDPRLTKVWGDEVVRISLKAKKVTPVGKYRFTIKKASF
ncbi:heparinase II/III family protein [Bacteroides sp. 519]|uniref:heparinase II/III domain-containing protein n=1 Tax=Bacteroides sp. 519 TaxID=2302937 RepID=UPI0013D1357B|nr:heparinase II/III family protein [Bacteroides sp. 519]NDV60423.1 heparinase [Bacteroides sp. 519]